ncbi:MAG: FAD binding domain-containing protein [Oscillospiraceae bacterium]|jgi:xanthine dehydrogenase YagS FAD-binding subunit|nr:FAD binding domain-containing protein [Oscillospiraceae bacterium]
MRPFNHINAASIAEAGEALKKGGAVAVAGGGDLLGALKDNIFPEYPRTVVNLKSIPGLNYIKFEDGALKLGALTTLADIARSPIVGEHAPALAAAAKSASSPALRETTTIGGNLCQLPRCWYFRKLNNRFDCARKGGERCFALTGDNRYHSVFGGAGFEAPGGQRACVAVNQGELAPVLIAMAARLKTTTREIEAFNFFDVGVLSSTVLEAGELLTEIEIPPLGFAETCRYRRFAFRKSIDFPIINLSIARGGENPNSPGKPRWHICIGGVAPTPHIAKAAEELLNVNAPSAADLTPELAQAAGVAATEGARAFESNAYKLQLIKTLIKRELLAMSAPPAD